MKKYVIGVDTGASKTLCGLFDEQMRLVRVIQRPTDAEATADELLDALDAHVRELARGAGVPLEDVRGLGAAFPSHVDFEAGVLLETADLCQLNDTPVRDMLRKRLGLNVVVDNESNAAALAEHRLGAGRGVRDMIYVSVATGVGGGLILGGDLYRGIHGCAGEIGHMFVSDSTGYPCGCGVSGCVESIASGLNMAKYAMERIQEGAESRILDHAGTVSRIDMKTTRWPSRWWSAGPSIWGGCSSPCTRSSTSTSSSTAGA